MKNLKLNYFKEIENFRLLKNTSWDIFTKPWKSKKQCIVSQSVTISQPHPSRIHPSNLLLNQLHMLAQNKQQLFF